MDMEIIKLIDEIRYMKKEYVKVSKFESAVVCGDIIAIILLRKNKAK
jgi:hypothetical protein